MFWLWFEGGPRASDDVAWHLTASACATTVCGVMGMCHMDETWHGCVMICACTLGAGNV